MNASWSNDVANGAQCDRRDVRRNVERRPVLIMDERIDDEGVAIFGARLAGPLAICRGGEFIARGASIGRVSWIA